MIDTNDILYKYFELHEKPSSIAKELNVVPSYVTKVVQKDDRYNEEKEYRLNLSKEKRKKDKRDWIRNKRQNEANKELYEFVKMQHIQKQLKTFLIPLLFQTGLLRNGIQVHITQIAKEI